MWVKMEEPNEPVIRAVLGSISKMEMKIFDGAGQVVHQVVIPNLPSGTINGEYYYDYAWEGPKLGGIYMAVVDGESAQGKIQARTKFVVLG